MQVQESLERNKSKSFRKPRSNEALLTGLLFCSCGERMYPKMSKRKTADGKVIYTYVCKMKERSQRTVCNSKNANGNTLDMAIIEQVKMLADDKETGGIENDDVDFLAQNIVFSEDGFPEFDVYKYGEFFGHFKLSIPGRHNVLNALACIALCDAYDISVETIKSAIENFKGADRRFEFKGMVNGAKVFDDYGHHPTEVSATAKALKNKKYNESWVVFQPHTYSRTFNLLNDFANALLSFDHIIVTDIYAARETNTYNISSKDLADAIIKLGKNAQYIPALEDCAKYLKENVKENDIVLTLGAGTVTNIGPMIVE